MGPHELTFSPTCQQKSIPQFNGFDSPKWSLFYGLHHGISKAPLRNECGIADKGNFFLLEKKKE